MPTDSPKDRVEKQPENPVEENCGNCGKPPALCVCDDIRKVSSRLQVLILQHPQEPDKELGSARIANLCLPTSSTLKIGLSWPNLKAALGREAQPSRWAVLYLGSGMKAKTESSKALHFVNKKGSPLPSPRPQELDGIVVIDGTWSQAKTLWWRNAWLLKLRRAILIPSRPSLYRELRKEPRRECLSTLETIAECFAALGENQETAAALRFPFEKLLEKKRLLSKTAREAKKTGQGK